MDGDGVPSDFEKMLTGAEVAAILNLPISSVNQLRRDGRIVAKQISARVFRYHRSDVRAYLDNLPNHAKVGS